MFLYWPLQLDCPSRSERNHENQEHFSKSRSWTTGLSYPPGACGTCTFFSSSPDLLNQQFWEWARESEVSKSSW